jgi:hypothetical protein
MSRGAVQKWGAGTLASMNAAGGGTNIPSLNYNQGGPVFNFENGGVVGNLPTTLGGGGLGLNPLMEQAKVRSKEHQGLFGRVKGGLDMLTGNRWDFDRQDVTANTKADANYNPYNTTNDDSRWENIPGTGLQRLKLSVNTGPQKSITPINPPVKIAPSTTNAKNVVKPPSSKRNVVQAYNQEKMRQQTVGGMIEGETGTKIPDFDANVYSSTEKIKVMGISL